MCYGFNEDMVPGNHGNNTNEVNILKCIFSTPHIKYVLDKFGCDMPRGCRNISSKLWITTDDDVFSLSCNLSQCLWLRWANGLFVKYLIYNLLLLINEISRKFSSVKVTAFLHKDVICFLDASFWQQHYKPIPKVTRFDDVPADSPSKYYILLQDSASDTFINTTMTRAASLDICRSVQN